MIKKRATVSAVHDDDLDAFLKSLGVFPDVAAGRTRCKFCGDSVNLETLSAVFPESGDIKFVCSKPVCMTLLAEYHIETHGPELEEDEPEEEQT